VSTDDQLAAERQQAPRAAIAALVAALAIVASAVIRLLALQDAPAASFVEALGRVEAGPIGDLPSLHAPAFEYFVDRFPLLLLSSVTGAIGAIGVGLALAFLAHATRARRPQFPRLGTTLPLVGGVLLAVGGVLTEIGTHQILSDIVDGRPTVDSVGEASRPLLLNAGQILGGGAGIPGVATFAVAGAYVLVSLNAMRVGLLTRFMGVLGILIGITLVLQIIPGPVQLIWLIALGALFLGRWPGGVPPAWRTGNAEPWPTNAEIRAAREAAAAERRAPAPAPDDLPERPSTPHPASKKRKRKRRG